LEGEKSLGIGPSWNGDLLGIGMDILKWISPNLNHMLCDLSSERDGIDRIESGEFLQGRKLGSEEISFRDG